jgi:DNA-binding CsgD family transcriptional regulator
MDFSSISSVSSAKRGIRSGSKVARKAFIHSSNQAASLLELKAAASQCRTPKQFRDLLDSLQAFIPYERFAGSWGYPSRTTIRFIFNQGFPTDFMRWYFTTGSQWTSPAFQEWLRTKRALLWADVAKRLKAQFDPELLTRIEQAGLQYSLCGGLTSHDHYVLLVAAMASEQSGRAHIKNFALIVPWLARASQRAYPRTLLTKRETVVLERRAMGEVAKKIAAAEGISERTVREHLQRIKKKLYTNDLVNAVVIAVRTGMLFHTWKEQPAGARS